DAAKADNFSLMNVSVVIITRNEEANLGATLESVAWAAERIVLDSGSTDGTLDVARKHGAAVFHEDWKGYAEQKNSALAKANSGWVLSLDADEQVSPELAASIQTALKVPNSGVDGYFIARRNLFLGRWIRRGGFYPDRKLRLFRRGKGRFTARVVHETLQVDGPTAVLDGDLVHNAYPTLTGYIETMNRYSSLGAEIARAHGHTSGSWLAFAMNVCARPAANFL